MPSGCLIRESQCHPGHRVTWVGLVADELSGAVAAAGLKREACGVVWVVAEPLEGGTEAGEAREGIGHAVTVALADHLAMPVPESFGGSAPFFTVLFLLAHAALFIAVGVPATWAVPAALLHAWGASLAAPLGWWAAFYPSQVALSLVLFGAWSALAPSTRPSMLGSGFGSGLFHLLGVTFFPLELLMAVAVVFVPGVLFGLTFPLANALYVRDLPRLGAGVGGVYFAITVGGILELKKVGDMAQDHSASMAIHMAESPIACMGAVHAAAATENFVALENHSVDEPKWKELVVGLPNPIVQDGYIAVPEGPGLGIESLNEELIAELVDPDGPEAWAPTDEWDDEVAHDRLWS